MKKLTILLLFLTSLTLAQNPGKTVNGAKIWADSLKTYGAGSVSDSVLIVDLEYLHGYPSVTVKDTIVAASGTITDSLKAYKGIIRYSSTVAKSAVDTLWSSEALPFYGQVWGTSDTTMTGNGKVKTYVILDKSIRLLKIIRVNAVITQGNKTDIIIESTPKIGF